MTRYAKGVTLKSSGQDADSRPAALVGAEQSTGKTVFSHTCQVTLPNGSTCQVDYRRYQARSHGFAFQDPVNQRLYVSGLLRGIPAIERKAQELVPEAFRKAQETEQQEMRRAVPAGGKSRAKPDNGPEMEAAAAERLAGKYAACVKTSTGRLIRLGPPHICPEAAVQEIQSGSHASVHMVNGQALVVGICSRTLRRWIEPQFLPGQEPQTKHGKDTGEHSDQDAEADSHFVLSQEGRKPGEPMHLR